ncbi:MAG: GNAT family acetyltransferase [Acetatifactor muris]|nr:GNAT family acetyltransferase [Acetatifactor muris]
MQEVSKYIVFNIREYLNGQNGELGEDDLLQVLSEFSCEKNPDVEKFAKAQSIEFARKQQSVTYLVFSSEDAELVGYFAITIKPITVNAEPFSNTAKRKLARVSELNEQNHTYNLAAYLIAQLGKNYHNGANERISGEELLGLAIRQIQQLQYLAGGMVVFLETLNEDKLLSFYQSKGFQQFDCRLSETVGCEPHELIQLLKILK